MKIFIIALMGIFCTNAHAENLAWKGKWRVTESICQQQDPFEGSWMAFDRYRYFTLTPKNDSNGDYIEVGFRDSAEGKPMVVFLAPNDQENTPNNFTHFTATKDKFLYHSFSKTPFSGKAFSSTEYVVNIHMIGATSAKAEFFYEHFYQQNSGRADINRIKCRHSLVR